MTTAEHDGNSTFGLFDYTFFGNTDFNNEPEFYIHDHLGNTRVVYTPVVGPYYTSYTLGALVDYFPYGKILRSYHNGEEERYLTTYHERDGETGLDYRGARFYDSDNGRFLSLDPLADDFSSWSRYNYVLGNPVRLIDSEGKAPTFPWGATYTFDISSAEVISLGKVFYGEHVTEGYWGFEFVETGDRELYWQANNTDIVSDAFKKRGIDNPFDIGNATENASRQWFPGLWTYTPPGEPSTLPYRNEEYLKGKPSSRNEIRGWKSSWLASATVNNYKFIDNIYSKSFNIVTVKEGTITQIDTYDTSCGGGSMALVSTTTFICKEVNKNGVLSREWYKKTTYFSEGCETRTVETLVNAK